MECAKHIKQRLVLFSGGAGGLNWTGDWRAGVAKKNDSTTDSKLAHGTMKNASRFYGRLEDPSNQWEGESYIRTTEPLTWDLTDYDGLEIIATTDRTKVYRIGMRDHVPGIEWEGFFRPRIAPQPKARVVRFNSLVPRITPDDPKELASQTRGKLQTGDRSQTGESSQTGNSSQTGESSQTRTAPQHGQESEDGQAPQDGTAAPPIPDSLDKSRISRFTVSIQDGYDSQLGKFSLRLYQINAVKVDCECKPKGRIDPLRRFGWLGRRKALDNRTRWRRLI